MNRRIRAVLLGFAPALLTPLAASACPLCLAAQDENVQFAYMFASAFMTFLPLVLGGALVYWLRRRARRIEFENAAGVIRLPTPAARPKTAA